MEKLLVSINNCLVVQIIPISLQVGKLISALMGGPKTGGVQTLQKNTQTQSLPELNISKKEEAGKKTVKNDETSGTEDSGKACKKIHTSPE